MVAEKKKSLRIALAMPEWKPFHDVMSGKPADATYVIQGNLARGLAARGHSLSFVAPNSTDELIVTTDAQTPRAAQRTWSATGWFKVASKIAWRVQKALGIPYLNYFSNRAFYDAALHALQDVDVVYERNGLYNVGVAKASRRLQIPYAIFFEADQIMELDMMGKPLSGLLRWRAAQLLRYNLNTADCIVCVTEVGRRQLIEKWGIPAAKVVVFPNAVHVDRFIPNPEARTRVRASLGMKEEPLIIFVGNFYHWHDVDTLLCAFASALKKYPEARLVLVGDGERRQEAMQLTTALGLDSAVLCTGIVSHDDVPRYIAAADIAVVPYPPMQQEMWLSPLKLFEYMSCGMAVIASAVGQVIDVVDEGKNGLLVPPGDVAAMSDALIKLIQDPVLRLKLGAQARWDAVEKYSWDSYLSRLEQMFEIVIDEGKN